MGPTLGLGLLRLYLLFQVSLNKINKSLKTTMWKGIHVAYWVGNSLCVDLMWRKSIQWVRLYNRDCENYKTQHTRRNLLSSTKRWWKCYSQIPRFCVEGLPKILDFGYFVLIWWQTDDKKQEILKQSCKTRLFGQNCQ